MQNSNNFIVNIVPLFNVANNASGDDTTFQLQTQLNSLATVVDTNT